MKKIWERVRAVFLRLSFSRKLSLICLVMILVPLIGNTLVFYYYSKRILEDRTLDYLQNLASVTTSKVEMSVENVEDTAFFIAGNEKMQEILSDSGEGLKREERYQQYKEARDLISNYALLSKEIASIYIYAQDGRQFGYTKISQVQPSRELLDEDSDWSCVDGHVYLRRTLRRYQDQSELGTLITEAVSSVFYDIVKDISYDAKSLVYIVDRDENVIAGQEASLTGRKLPEGFLQVLEDPEKKLGSVEFEGETYAVYTGEEIENGWRLVLALQENYFMKDVQRLQTFWIILTFITGVLAVFLIILAANGITRPIKRLSGAMEAVGQGDFEISCLVEGEDEIAVLSRTFNQMVLDMRNLIDTMYEQEMMKQEVEMKSLQMQINPHFLYNTLDTINWIARMKGVDEIGEMTSALGNLMRYSLTKKDFVTVEEELANLRNYIGIQNVRYGDRMRIEFQVEQEVLGFYIPKLLVQPILENAIVHGVEEKLEPALIQILAYQENENLYIVVEDDGVGMTQDVVEALMSMDDNPGHKKGHTSIGVHNVNRRIQKVFGPECGLQIKSQLGAGTRITLCMKKMTDCPDIHLKYNN